MLSLVSIHAAVLYLTFLDDRKGSQTLSVCSAFRMRDQVFHSSRTASEITFESRREQRVLSMHILSLPCFNFVRLVSVCKDRGQQRPKILVQGRPKSGSSCAICFPVRRSVPCINIVDTACPVSLLQLRAVWP